MVNGSLVMVRAKGAFARTTVRVSMKPDKIAWKTRCIYSKMVRALFEKGYRKRGFVQYCPIETPKTIVIQTVSCPT